METVEYVHRLLHAVWDPLKISAWSRAYPDWSLILMLVPDM
jgi:hypothetical protein